MATPIIMPKFGQMTEESTIVEWRKKEGDKVAKGDILFDVETDKSVMEVESFADGILLRIDVLPGVPVPVQSTVGFIGQPGESIPEIGTPPPPKEAETAVPPPVLDRVSAGDEVTAPLSDPQPAASTRFLISPRAGTLARESAIDPTRITGSGPEGRVTEKDVRAYLAAHNYDQILITPSAKVLAVREKLDILSLKGTGDSGRITDADVEQAITGKPKPMSKMRQLIAQRLQQSVVTAPHFYVTVEVDMTDLVALRARLKERGASLTLTDFIAKAAVLTLQEFPDVNSTTDGRSVRWHNHVGLGLAVSLPQGLVVPVVRNADELSLAELSRQARMLVEKARLGNLEPDEMSGGTFTISNMGMLDVENFTAIINPGESAILAVSSTLKKPAVYEEKIVARSLMKMTLSSDHRIIDGVLAARFANAVKQKLVDIDLWNRLMS
jgi:pyruvate dehydrogenase E2 component (dihydrolipoamide acetyltransferase)